MLDRVTLEHVVAWEINHIELYVIIVADCLSLHISSWEQKEGLVWTHLLEDHLADTCLTRSRDREQAITIVKPN